jgi:predicted dinucleotide-binding enzyme
MGRIVSSGNTIARTTMRVGILGSGLMGGKLGTIFARAGHEVTFSYSHTRRKLERLARGAGRRARAGTPAEAVRDADSLLLARALVPTRRCVEAGGRSLGQDRDQLFAPDEQGRHRAGGRTSSGAEKLARTVRHAHVVSALNTVPSEVLFGVFKSRKRSRPSLVYCGDDAGAKEVAAELIRDARFDPADAGPLGSARYTEPFALLAAQLAYEGEGGPALAYRFERFAYLRR